MKEKINKFLEAVFSYKGAAWVNIIFFAMFLFFAVYHSKVAIAFIGFPHLMYAAFCGLLHLERKEVTFYKKKYLSWRSLAELAAERYDCYKRLYGELPPGKTKEEKKEEQA